MNAIATVEPREIAAPAATPAGMLAYAMSKDVDVEKLERLYALQQQWEKDEARRQFHQALAEFKAQPLAISKDKRVYFKGKDGKPDTDFYHATLGNVVATIAPALGQQRLSHSWSVKREGDRVHVTCRLTHALGHSEEITLDGPLDVSGSKNNIQSLGSTITYLERYTLLAITGLATEDQDDDGAGAEPLGTKAGAPEPILSAELQDLITDLNAKADEGLDALTAAWAAMSPAARAKVGARFGAIKRRAEAVGQ